MSQQPNLVAQNQQLHKEIKRRIDQITAINMVAASVGHSLDLNHTLDIALEAVTQVLGAEAAGISLIDEAAGEVVLRAQLGWLNDFVVENPMRIPLGKGMSGMVIDNDDVVVHHDLEGEDFAVQRFSKERFRSIVMAPMHARGRIIGILSIMSHQPHRFDEEIVSVLRSIADTVGVAIDNASLYEQHVEQENRLNAILHSTADGILATDQNSRISLCNYAAAMMLDVEPEDLVGVPLREADIQVKVRDQLLLALAPENKGRDLQSFQVSVEGGRELSVLVSPVEITSQVSGASQMDGWVIVLQDITHIREAEIGRVRFIQAAAHDMKNPLSVTQKSLQLLEDILESDDETTTEVLQMARSGVERVQRLIDDLLNIEKIESGYNFKLEDVDIREMVHETSAQSKPLLLERDIEYSLEITDDVPAFITIDREWVQRALSNYLENASKYAPGGWVRFQVFRRDQDIYFEVIDNGSGIPLQAQARLFDRFYRVENRRDIGGSGLGLAIVKSVADAHNGHAYVHSKEHEGSTFGLKLPLSD